MILHYLSLFLHLIAVKAHRGVQRDRKIEIYMDQVGVELCHQENVSLRAGFVDKGQQQTRCLTPDLHVDKCSVYERILQDLEPFQGGIRKEAILDSFGLPAYRYKKIFVRICQGKIEIFRQKGENLPHNVIRRARAVKQLIVDLMNRVYLPDVELVLSFGDAPSMPKQPDALPLAFMRDKSSITAAPRLPIFSVCKTSDFYDILFPFTMIHHGFISKGICPKLKTRPWRIRESKLNTRFTTTDFATYRWLHANESAALSHRAVYAKLSDSKDIDIRFVRLPKSLAQEMGILPREYGQRFALPFFSKFNFKYLLSIDGNGYQSSFKNIARGGSLIFKVNTFPNGAQATFEHWYAGVLEGQDLIGIHNSSEIGEWILWAQTHDREAKKMAYRLGAKVEKYLSKDHIQCYLFRLLQSYSFLLQYDVGEEESKRHKGMEKLEFRDLRSTSRQSYLNEPDSFIEWCMNQR